MDLNRRIAPCRIGTSAAARGEEPAARFEFVTSGAVLYRRREQADRHGPAGVRLLTMNMLPSHEESR
jgi:hypothetical protein